EALSLGNIVEFVHFHALQLGDADRFARQRTRGRGDAFEFRGLTLEFFIAGQRCIGVAGGVGHALSAAATAASPALATLLLPATTSAEVLSHGSAGTA